MAQTKIAGLFLDPTVISGLTAITSGASDADYLFVWDATDSLLKKILPDNLGLAAAAHTIESHTSTSATGANLETLTNAGDADALHTHDAKASLSGAIFTGTVTTPSVLFKGSSNAVTMDVGSSVAAYSVILPDAAPTADDKILKTSGGSPYSQLVWGDAGGGNAFTNDVTITSGNVVIGTVGKGIDFSNQADQATGETMSSELLDFYEEGSFVPRISMYNNIGSSTASHTATTKGTYVRIGKMCYFQIYLMLDHPSGGLGSESGDALITPLPFTASDREIAINVGYFDSMGITAGMDVGGYINASTTRIRLRLSDHANGQTNLQMSEFSSDGQIFLNGCYEVA